MPILRPVLMFALVLAGALPARAETLLRLVNGPGTGATWFLVPTRWPASATFRRVAPGTPLGDPQPFIEQGLLLLKPGEQLEFRAAGEPSSAAVLAFRLMCWEPIAQLELSDAPDAAMLQAFRGVGSWDPATRTLTLGASLPSPAIVFPRQLSLASLVTASFGTPQALAAATPPSGPGAGGRAALPSSAAGAGAGPEVAEAARKARVPARPMARKDPKESLAAPGAEAAGTAEGSRSPAPGADPSGGKRKPASGKRKPGPEAAAPPAKRLRTAGPGAGLGPEGAREGRHPDVSHSSGRATQTIRNEDPRRTWTILLYGQDRTVQAQVRGPHPLGDQAGGPATPSLVQVPPGEPWEVELEPGATLQLTAPLAPGDATWTVALSCAAMQDFAKQGLAYRWTFGAGGNRLLSARDVFARAGNPWEAHCWMEPGGLVVTGGQVLDATLGGVPAGVELDAPDLDPRASGPDLAGNLTAGFCGGGQSLDARTDGR